MHGSFSGLADLAFFVALPFFVVVDFFEVPDFFVDLDFFEVLADFSFFGGGGLQDFSLVSFTLALPIPMVPRCTPRLPAMMNVMRLSETFSTTPTITFDALAECGARSDRLKKTRSPGRGVPFLWILPAALTLRVKREAHLSAGKMSLPDRAVT